jgi:hypothetical protein
MNNSIPLIREGVRPFRGKSSLFFKVMVTLTIHVVVIGGLLLQGCKDTTAKDKKAPGAPAVGKVMAHAHSLTP